MNEIIYLFLARFLTFSVIEALQTSSKQSVSEDNVTQSAETVKSVQ
jgi:hypothetical protein